MARKKKAEESSAGAPWLNTFADLMNLLLCFFVLLFASSTVDAEKYEKIVQSMTNSFSIFSGGRSVIDESRLISSGISQLNDFDQYFNTTGRSDDEAEVDSFDKAVEEILEQQKKASQEMYDEISDVVDKKNLEDYIELSIDPNFQYVKISLSGSILFDSGKADIKTEALPIFGKVGDVVKLYDKYLIEIEGHTDNVPIRSSSYPDNNWLSSARALNAAEYLIKEKGMDPKTLKWTGRGEYDPIAGNETDVGKAKNRRVEIKIYNDINN
ncbi:chemotaxis protein MotB [Anaerocolumna cellulosilytica]|uniref:Chemotaxis protein MotB n=1 Tax=Anaerocolumna cellulosilytica TaxID=433286 RepID=A0A6S6R8B4_9FIRM|nr:flagellar motor protein MotB [Anaerocolumna cellulosilytica]MBB5197024.1 chemotaxis protein MotB [Anaerocolumna cellulosilytica]BCJ95238.1 chemotaxis protein MotB [Anaerocolumna cellulosilytica]